MAGLQLSRFSHVVILRVLTLLVNICYSIKRNSDIIFFQCHILGVYQTESIYRIQHSIYLSFGIILFLLETKIIINGIRALLILDVFLSLLLFFAISSVRLRDSLFLLPCLVPENHSLELLVVQLPVTVSVASLTAGKF